VIASVTEPELGVWAARCRRRPQNATSIGASSDRLPDLVIAGPRRPGSPMNRAGSSTSAASHPAPSRQAGCVRPAAALGAGQPPAMSQSLSRTAHREGSLRRLKLRLSPTRPRIRGSRFSRSPMQSSRLPASEPTGSGSCEFVGGSPKVCQPSIERTCQMVKPRMSCAVSSGTSSWRLWPLPSRRTQSVWGSPV
jgi:hypothetical protein